MESRQQNCTHMTSLCIQFEKLGRGLLREAFQGERECFFYVGSPSGLPLFGHLRSVFLILQYYVNNISGDGFDSVDLI